jgi:hypothetical protein
LIWYDSKVNLEHFDILWGLWYFEILHWPRCQANLGFQPGNLRYFKGFSRFEKSRKGISPLPACVVGLGLRG